jgi:hypothetical protein
MRARVVRCVHYGFMAIRGVVWCGVVWCGVVWCGVVWCGVVWPDAWLRSGVRCSVRDSHREYYVHSSMAYGNLCSGVVVREWVCMVMRGTLCSSVNVKALVLLIYCSLHMCGFNLLFFACPLLVIP